MASADQAFRIDDRDPQIRYSFYNDWNATFINDPAIFNATVTVTTQVGANFAFTFTGVQVAVYGTLGSNESPPLILQFSIDNGHPVVYNAPVPVDGPANAFLFFQSDVLSPTGHQIVAEVQRASDIVPFIFDYLTVLPVGASTVTPPPSAMSSVAGSVTGTVTDSQATEASPTGLQNNGNRGVNGATLRARSVAGGVIGGVAFIVFALLGFWWWRHKRNIVSSSHMDETIPTSMMRDTGSPVLSGPFAPVTLGHEDDSRTTPYLIPQAHNLSMSPAGELPSNSFANINSAQSHLSPPQPLSDLTFVGDHSSSFAARAVAAVAAGVTRRSDRKRVQRQPTTVIFPTSNDSQTQQPALNALPGPALPEYVDSGMRFHLNAEVEEVPVLPIGAPPAYTAT